MKSIIFSQHALEQLKDRGATQSEVEDAIQNGEKVPAKEGRLTFRKNFAFKSNWKRKYYEVKQVMPIVVEEPEQWVIITVYVFYFGGEVE